MTDERWSWERCAAACERLLAALDWEALGELYFHVDGIAHWQARRPEVLDLGLRWARELLRRVPRTGRSLYVGAGIAELPVMLAERGVAGREVVAWNRNRRECELIAAGLRSAGLAGVLAVTPADAATAEAADYDHLACVSLFTDPDAWPALSGVAYGRIPPVQLDLQQFAREREQARALARRLFGGLRRPGWITTTGEELAWFLEQADAAAVPWAVDDLELPTAVVGDPIGFLRVDRGVGS